MPPVCGVAVPPSSWYANKLPAPFSSNSNGLVQSSDLVTTISLTDGADFSPSTASTFRKTSYGIVSLHACGALSICPDGLGCRFKRRGHFPKAGAPLPDKVGVAAGHCRADVGWRGIAWG